MSGRLNQQRQDNLQPQRIEHAKKKLAELGIKIEKETPTELHFVFKGHTVTFFPYSGWHTGKTIKDGRGLDKLLIQLK